MAKIKEDRLYLPERAILGQAHPDIEKWDSYLDIDYVIRNKPVELPNDRPDGFSDEDEIAYRSALQKLESIKASPSATSEQGEATRIKQIEFLEDKILEYSSRRKALTEWERREISRCIFGWNTLTGYHYFWLRFCRTQVNIEGGGSEMINPSYRADEDWYFRLYKTCREECTGVIGGKRRRYGNTVKYTCLCMYEMLFRSSSLFFITVTEDDGEKFYKKFFDEMWKELPAFLKPAQKALIKNESTRSFVPTELITDVRRYFWQHLSERGWGEPEMRRYGLLPANSNPPNSNLRTASCKNDEALVGDGVSVVFVDEVGEMHTLGKVFNKIIPMLSAGSSRKRAGCLMALGTVGNMNAAGNVFRVHYNSASSFHLRKVLIAGWMGENFDECGNINIENECANIRAEVAEHEANKRYDLAVEHRQKYPLTEEDMFLQDTTNKVMPMEYVAKAEERLKDIAPDTGLEFGKFIRTPTGEVSFVAMPNHPAKDTKNYGDELGYDMWVIAERPDPNRAYKEMYVAGCDPIDLDRDKYREQRGKSGYMLSDFAGIIYKRGGVIGGLAECPVAWYLSKPEDLDDAYEQMLLCQEWYSQTLNGMDYCRVNIERQKGTRMYAYYKNQRKAEFIAHAVGVVSADGKSNTWGFHNTEKWWTDAIGDAKDWWKKFWPYLFCRTLVREAGFIREANTDLSVAFFAARQYSRELDSRDAVSGKQTIASTKRTNPRIYYVQRPDGTITPNVSSRVSYEQRRQKNKARQAQNNLFW